MSSAGERAEADFHEGEAVVSERLRSLEGNKPLGSDRLYKGKELDQEASKKLFSFSIMTNGCELFKM